MEYTLYCSYKKTHLINLPPQHLDHPHKVPPITSPEVSFLKLYNIVIEYLVNAFPCVIICTFI